MAKYFNPKEDVIEIQLTQYGKSLLSKGKFKPHSYAFFDNDILYNSRFAHLSESQNDAHQRIMDMTPRMQPQYVYRGIESDLQKNFDTLIADDINVEISASKKELKQLKVERNTHAKKLMKNSSREAAVKIVSKLILHSSI